MTKGGGFYPSRDYVGLSGMLKNQHTNIQALFRSYLRSRPEARPAVVQEILHQLHTHLEMEENVLCEVVRNNPRKTTVDPSAEDPLSSRRPDSPD